MEKEFSELIEYLDERFVKIENILETKADKSDLDNLTNAVDAYAKKANSANCSRNDNLQKSLTTVINKKGTRPLSTFNLFMV